MTKDELRKKYKEIRKNISNKKEQSNLITELVLNNDIYLKSNIIAFYYPLPDEVDTIELITKSLELNKKVCLPKVNGNTMEFYLLNDLSNLTVGSFNIKEPTTNTIVNINDIELMFIPGIYFDTNNNRIGYGKGYYDTYLSHPNTIYKIGLSYRETSNKEIIPTNKHDISLDITLHP